MVKMDYKNLCGLPSLRDVLHQTPSSPSDLVDSSKNGSSSPLPSSTSCDLVELNESHDDSHNIHRFNPEDSPAPSPVQPLLPVSSVRTQVSTDEDVLVMDGALVDGGPRSPSSVMRSVSFIDNNRHCIRRSASVSDLIVISSGAHQGSSIGRSGGGSSRGSNSRRSGFLGQPGSWSRRHAQGAGPSYFQQRQQLPPFPSNIQQGQQYTYNNMQLPQYPRHMTPPAYMPPWVAPASPAPCYTFAPPMVTIPPAGYYPPYGIRRPGVYPPPGITIRHPGGSAPPPQPRRSVTPIVIRAPPADEAGTPAPKQTETPPPAPEQPEPTSGQESFVLGMLYGPSTSGRPRLPVFRDICPDDEAGQAPPPPPPCV